MKIRLFEECDCCGEYTVDCICDEWCECVTGWDRYEDDEDDDGFVMSRRAGIETVPDPHHYFTEVA